MKKLTASTQDRAARRHMIVLSMIALFVIWMALGTSAHASEAGTGLEWEAPLQAFVRSVTGPVAFGVAFLAMCTCGFLLAWGGEINEFVRRVIMLILVLSIIMFAGNILRRMFAGGAAVITPPPVVQQPADQGAVR